MVGAVVDVVDLGLLSTAWDFLGRPSADPTGRRRAGHPGSILIAAIVRSRSPSVSVPRLLEYADDTCLTRSR